MKYFFYFFVLSTYSIFSQNIGSNGVRSDSRINDLFELIKNRVNKYPNTNPTVKGSEYFDKIFKPAEVKYFDKDLDENIFLRYNAYKDEIEFSNNPKTLSSDKILMKNMNISCSIEDEKYVYTNYININGLRKEGYLVVLFIGKKYALYEKRIKLFMEGSEAKTSLERSFDPRFVEKFKYYVSKNNSEKKEIKINKKNLVELLGYDARNKKIIIKQNKLKFKTVSDVITILEEFDQI
tara:strand:- start:69 stop:779 length:711 start_codon:yes stop_codon:yes gene_type:complete